MVQKDIFFSDSITKRFDGHYVFGEEYVYQIAGKDKKLVGKYKKASLFFGYVGNILLLNWYIFLILILLSLKS